MKHIVVRRYVAVWCLLVCGLLPLGSFAQTFEQAVDYASKVDLSESEWVAKRLQAHYQSWKGTRYKKGGASKKGVDCSAFIAIAFKDALQRELPRSAASQAKVGKAIAKEQLRPGDLVFFKTRIISKHVGVYLGAGKFMHVSSKRGVMISALTDYYWAKKYWKSRRVE